MAINKRKILESAQKHLQRGALDKALEDYRTVLKADPHDSNVLLKVGDLYLKQGKRDEAINAYLRVAQQFTREGFDAKAVALYKQISRLDPKRQDVCVPLAELYARMGLVGDAISALQGAADAAYRGGDKDGALELLRRMASLDPANTQNRLKVAELLAQEGRATEAVAEYEAVAEELGRRGEDEERMRVLERLVAAAPERSEALVEVARAKLAQNQFAIARKLAERLLVVQPDDLSGREILGHALLGDGDEAAARDTFRELAELYRLRGDEGRARDLMQRFGGVEALGADDSDAHEESEPPVLELEDDAPIDDFLLDEAPAPPPAPAAKVASKPAPKPAPKATQAAAAPPARTAPAPPARTAPPPAARADEPIDPDQLMAEATVYLRYGKHERAVATLRTVLAAEPRHRAALESLGEALALQGELANAVTAWQRAAEGAQADGDADALERIRERLASVDEAAAAALAPELVQADERTTEVALDLDESEFEIDLDLGGSLEADESIEDPTLAASGGEGGVPIELAGLEDAASEELSFDPPESLVAVPESLAVAPEAEPMSLELAAPEPGLEEAAPAHAPEEPEEPTASTSSRVAEDLEEAEFYFEQGLHDEARALYERILVAAPNHPQAMVRLGEIAARSGAPQPALTPPRPLAHAVPAEPASLDLGGDFDIEIEPPSEPAPEPEPEAEPAPEPPRAEAEITSPGFALSSSDDTGDFDLAAAIGDESSARTLAGTEEEGFEEVFQAFKSGVERELGEGDHEARYDLGIAYKEMGLLDDAIAAFRIAMLAPARQLPSLHMMGLCALELGRAADAVAHLEQALSLPELPADQRIPLRYDLGRAYAASGDVARARGAFEEVRTADPSFGDVERELAALTEAAPRAEAPDEDASAGEAYESFDDLIGESAAAPPPPPRYESFEDLFGDDGDADAPADAAPAASQAAPLELAEPEPPVQAPALAADEPASEPISEPAPAPAEPPAPTKRRRKISFV